MEIGTTQISINDDNLKIIRRQPNPERGAQHSLANTTLSPTNRINSFTSFLLLIIIKYSS